MEDSGGGGRVLQTLKDLLNPVVKDEELDVTTTTYATPGHIGSFAATSSRRAENRRKDNDDIWEEGDVSEQLQHDHRDHRVEPKYEVVFRQEVGAEDVFLSMSGKNPSSAYCHQQIVRISLPQAQLEEVELRVTDTFLDCSTPTHRLGLHLPNRVLGEKSQAKWLTETHTLEVVLQLNREYEDLN